jgi:outer membrane cobalamin receptor
MIIWVPESEFVWIPQNIASVMSKGIEIEQHFSYTKGNHLIKLLGSYYYTNVSRTNALAEEDNAVGKQLIYVPSDMASFSSVYRYKKFMLIWNSSYTGKRYIAEDNSESLPSFWLSSASVENTFSLRSSLIALRFKVDNIFGKNYQSVKDYPMPWRSYMLSLTYKFSSE